jgi:hypothetical protein
LIKSHTLDASSDVVVFGGFLPGCVMCLVRRMMIDATERHQQVYDVLFSLF